MIYNEEAYYTGYYRNVRAIKAVPALVFDTIVGLLRDPNNKTGEIANKTLCDMLGVTKHTVIESVNKLVKSGYIEVSDRDGGRGNKSVYILTEKGVENAPFMGEKGCRNLSKRVQKMHEKGAENAPINKELNKELKEREVTPTPISNQNEKIFMKDFETWWSKYPGDPDYSYDKENCEKVWSLMQPEWREKLVTMAERGIRWRTKQNDKPIFYLRYYAGQDAQMELPFVRQGSKQFAQWIEDHERKDRICFIHYGEDEKNKGAFCLEKDLQTMIDAGAVWVRNWNF